ncbi:hypothetical protein [Pantoea sp. ACRSB]|uniref:hypothetical protein n=1 Tax=Pantoea sp. ACRSB TaxID=2918207 RepID=UPI0028936ED8|nr:hypothetical protein [Pantoea sp. ACRSB]MCG7387300.1 hypothetical protein [Pantoea sp. ACRSB]
MFSESFQQFLIEASLASSSIRGGLTALNRCTITDKGTFYSAFFPLSVGLERFFKIIYILQYMVNNNLNKPEFKEIRALGHDIRSLHKAAADIGKNHTENTSLFDLNDLQSDIINMLSDFGDQSRYYVLNTITKAKKKTNDPLQMWNDIIDSGFWLHFSESKRKKVVDNAISIVDRSGEFTYSQYFSLDGFIMSEIDFIVLDWKIKNVSPCIVAEIIALLQPYYTLLCKLRESIFIIDQSKGSREQPVPYFEELFPYLLESPTRAKKRKNWLQ